MPKPLVETLKLLQGGAFLDRAADLLAETVKQVDETGKAGKLTIVLDLKRQSGAIAITAKVTNKVPETAPDSDLLWATVEGNLSVKNPAQRDLALEVVPQAPRQVGSVEQEKPAVNAVG